MKGLILELCESYKNSCGLKGQGESISSTADAHAVYRIKTKYNSNKKKKWDNFL